MSILKDQQIIDRLQKDILRVYQSTLKSSFSLAWEDIDYGCFIVVYCYVSDTKKGFYLKAEINNFPHSLHLSKDKKWIYDGFNLLDCLFESEKAIFEAMGSDQEEEW